MAKIEGFFIYDTSTDKYIQLIGEDGKFNKFAYTAVWGEAEDCTLINQLDADELHDLVIELARHVIEFTMESHKRKMSVGELFLEWCDQHDKAMGRVLSYMSKTGTTSNNVLIVPCVRDTIAKIDTPDFVDAVRLV